MAAMNLSNGQFEQLHRGDKPLLVDFWAPWCGYCRRLGPAYERVARDWQDAVEVAGVNIDEEPLLADRERIEVIPTLVLYHRGEALGSIVAPQSKAEIDGFLRQSLGM